MPVMKGDSGAAPAPTLQAAVPGCAAERASLQGSQGRRKVTAQGDPERGLQAQKGTPAAHAKVSKYTA